MATNPMQRKARNSFLLGMLITLVIAGAIIALLFIQLKNYKEKEQEEKANSVKVWVLGQDVISGQVITTEMVCKSNEKTTDDLRKVEYNVLTLPSQLQTGEYIDVRLALPSGQDYIVVSKKQVEIPQVSGVDVADTIWLKLTEDEIITMNNAIVDSARALGSVLKVTIYTEAGTQEAATPTYVPSKEVAELIRNNPNIVEKSKVTLINRYNSNANTRNDALNPAISTGEEGEENLKTKVQESVTNSKENRQKYLQSLGGTE